jgi:hypothetical protein
MVNPMRFLLLFSMLFTIATVLSSAPGSGSVYDYSLKTIDGAAAPLSQYKGR